ncbi:hypothetical protein IV203_021029 [Nitzschia inconspicua]|uniref:Uncharacterized protein n=1 Tax=Nitzschia inconspicua TaxID=303405 RepID=A0A9K3KG32_9STRA|nr:hypothetical protein IV203_021029 [Nitzschia inconspicua]
MKAAANVQGVRASYNQAYRAIGRAVANGPREIQQASFGLNMSYWKHFQLRNEDYTVKAKSDADQRLRRLGMSWDHAALFAAYEACAVSRWGPPHVKMEGNPVHCFGADHV